MMKNIHVKKNILYPLICHALILKVGRANEASLNQLLRSDLKDFFR